jgi:flagellar FliL protein
VPAAFPRLFNDLRQGLRVTFRPARQFVPGLCCRLRGFNRLLTVLASKIGPRDGAPSEGSMAEADKDAKTEGAPAEGEAAAAKKKSPLLLILMIVVPVLLLGGGGAAAYFLFFAKKDDAAVAKAEEAKPPKPAVFYNLPELLVNLNGGQGRRSSFLKISLSLELSDPADIQRVEAVLPRVIDAFQTYLRELRPEDLRGSAGLYRLREELLARVNTSAQPAKVNDVLFKEMLLQ